LLAVEIESVLSNNPFEQTLVRLYPNPVADQLFILGFEHIESASVINMLGQTVLEIKNPQEATLNVGDLKSGAYLMRLQTTIGPNQTLRFIKQ